jgi:hypothetical protein
MPSSCPITSSLDLVQMAVDRNLLRTLGMRDARKPVDMRYALTDEGKRWTIDALERLRYVGPAPVTLDHFTEQRQPAEADQRTGHLRPHPQRPQGELTFDDSIIEQCGPALNSGRAMLLYGPPGNGKTSVAHCLGNVFSDVIYVPYAVSVEGQIIRVHDPSVHIPVGTDAVKDDRAPPRFSAPRSTMRAGCPAAGPSSSPAANSRSRCSTSATTPPATSTRLPCT